MIPTEGDEDVAEQIMQCKNNDWKNKKGAGWLIWGREYLEGQ
jgi:hypothetical protein